MVTRPFHLSFVVSDLDAVRGFYVDVLGCEIGRDLGDWIDILFFGHQLTIHQENDREPAVAIDHFGLILDKPTWLGVAETCKTHSIEFAMDPRIIGEGTESESGKYVVFDPAGNHIEFKYYKDFGGTVGGNT